MTSPRFPSISPLGLDGVLVTFADALDDATNLAALAFRARLDAANVHGVVETASSLTSVFVRFRPDEIKRENVTERVLGLLADFDTTDPALPEGRMLWTLPAAFGEENGPQLAEVAAHLGRSEQDAVDDLNAVRLRVLALGFAPGQPYLGLMPEAWDIPRQASVTPQVPAGAIVVAVRQVIPFANAAPTGWRQVGRTSFRCYDANRDVPLPLKAGDEVCFEQVSPTELSRLEMAENGMGGARQEPIR